MDHLQYVHAIVDNLFGLMLIGLIGANLSMNQKILFCFTSLMVAQAYNILEAMMALKLCCHWVAFGSMRSHALTMSSFLKNLVFFSWMNTKISWRQIFFKVFFATKCKCHLLNKHVTPIFWSKKKYCLREPIWTFFFLCLLVGGTIATSRLERINLMIVNCWGGIVLMGIPWGQTTLFSKCWIYDCGK